MSLVESVDPATILNRDCYCIGVDRAALRDSLEAHLAGSGLSAELLDANSQLFAGSPVFLAQKHLQEMQQLVDAIERVAHNDAYRETVLAAAPLPTRTDLGPRGVFFGYDFHLGADGPRLIEINTNAGGVLLSMYLAAAQQACCDALITLFGGQAGFADAEESLLAMFKEEWALQRPGQTLRTIAIVDHEPVKQFLYPEFLLFRSLFERHGITALIADPGDFTIKDKRLFAAGHEIDLVYNRLTDFYLELPASACLRRAYRDGIAALTPSPYHYALYADKRNLPLLSDAVRLAALGVADDDIAVLQRSLPATVAVTQDNAAELWSNRKQLFFKPATGHASRGVYRGAKLTKRVWDDIIRGDYIAQAMVHPSERQLIVDGVKQSLKLDIRCVTYNGCIQQLSARLYRGQTTNLRTAGGGLATVFATPGRRELCG